MSVWILFSFTGNSSNGNISGAVYNKKQIIRPIKCIIDIVNKQQIKIILIIIFLIHGT